MSTPEQPSESTPSEERTAQAPQAAPPRAPAGDAAAAAGTAPAPDAPKTAGDERPEGMPQYKGEPLDAERGPGLGCFWIQIGLLTFFLILTPLTVTWGWDPAISAALLIFTLVLLLFSGQTIIFLLRLVAADRRTRRAPLDPKAKPTVGQMEEADARPDATASDADVSGATIGEDATVTTTVDDRPPKGDERPEGGR